MGLTVNGPNINKGKQFFDDSMNIEINGTEKVRKRKEPLTKKILQKQLDAVDSLITSPRMYFVVCKYMMWEGLCPIDDFQKAIDILKEIRPGVKINYSNMTDLNKGSFRGTLEEWDPDDCPLKTRRTFNFYYALAFALYNV